MSFEVDEIEAMHDAGDDEIEAILEEAEKVRYIAVEIAKEYLVEMSKEDYDAMKPKADAFVGYIYRQGGFDVDVYRAVDEIDKDTPAEPPRLIFKLYTKDQPNLPDILRHVDEFLGEVTGRTVQASEAWGAF